ncbi:MAG TPA: hypothetical protein VLW85_08435 [Myxococcales bacterium]|nr:hypothetical protein [Myxococcales bacterium]
MKSEPPGHSPADFRRRVLARAVDLLIAVAPMLLVPRGRLAWGEGLCAALLLCGDGLFGPGRSLGKRLAGLRVMSLSTWRPAPLRATMVRNALFALALLPALLGAHLEVSAAALLCMLTLEGLVATRPLTRDLGRRRLGDLLAGTQVIDASIAIGLPAPVPETRSAPAPFASRAA